VVGGQLQHADRAAAPLLLHDDPDGVPPASVPVPSDDDAIAAFQARAAVSGGGLQVEGRPATPKADPYAPPARRARR
jgi:hypothetical protein